MCFCKGRRGSVPRRVWRAGAPFLGRVCLVCVCGILLMVAQHCTQLSPLALKHKKRPHTYLMRATSLWNVGEYPVLGDVLSCVSFAFL